MTNRSKSSGPLAAGLLGGLAGGVIIWLYEAVVWVGVQHQMSLAGIAANATGLVFGSAVQSALGPGAYLLGTLIHFSFALAWGVLFALVWPPFRRRGFEATFIALGYALVVWVVMHLAIVLVSSSHPRYSDPNVVIGGLLSHLFYAVPLALVVKRRLPAPMRTEQTQSIPSATVWK